MDYFLRLSLLNCACNIFLNLLLIKENVTAAFDIFFWKKEPKSLELKEIKFCRESSRG